MRLARFADRAGVVRWGQVQDDGQARPLRGDLFAPWEFEDQPVPPARLLAPLAPVNIFAIGRNYAAHVRETGAARPDRPLVFMKPTTAVVAPDEAIRLPASAPEQVDFEAELAVVIGRTARRVNAAEAEVCVLGFTCANDVTARDCQAGDKQWSRAKGFDTFCPLGPWLVTPDELDVRHAAIRCRLNGTVMQDAVLGYMIFGPYELISYLSQQFTLLPGPLILTGTPEGVGFVRQPPVFLRAGDRVEVEIAGIGTLANTVAAD